MDSMTKIIRRHNKKILKPKSTPSEMNCNCRRKPECPLSGSCLTKSIVYKAEISSSDQEQKALYRHNWTRIQDEIQHAQAIIQSWEARKFHQIVKIRLGIEEIECWLFHQVLHFETREGIHRWCKTMWLVFSGETLCYKRKQRRSFKQKIRVNL